MKSIRSTFRHAHKRGGRYYAVVENVRLGLATVRLKANGARLTNLHVVGDYVQNDDLVVVDYGGIKPVVKPAKAVEGEVILDLPPADALEIERNWEGEDHGVAAYNTGNQNIPYNTWVPVSYNQTKWDTDYFWNAGTPERLVSPVDGYFLVVFNWAWIKTGRLEYDVWNASYYNWAGNWDITYDKIQEVRNNYVRIVHSAEGLVFRAQDKKPLYDVVDTRDSLFFSVRLLAGEYIYAEVITENPFNESRTLKGSSSGLYPKLQLQFRHHL